MVKAMLCVDYHRSVSDKIVIKQKPLGILGRHDIFYHMNVVLGILGRHDIFYHMNVVVQANHHLYFIGSKKKNTLDILTKSNFVDLYLII